MCGSFLYLVLIPLAYALGAEDSTCLLQVDSRLTLNSSELVAPVTYVNSSEMSAMSHANFTALQAPSLLTAKVADDLHPKASLISAEAHLLDSELARLDGGIIALIATAAVFGLCILPIVFAIVFCIVGYVVGEAVGIIITLVIMPLLGVFIDFEAIEVNLCRAKVQIIGLTVHNPYDPEAKAGSNYTSAYLFHAGLVEFHCSMLLLIKGAFYWIFNVEEVEVYSIRVEDVKVNYEQHAFLSTRSNVHDVLNHLKGVKNLVPQLPKWAEADLCSKFHEKTAPPQMIEEDKARTEELKVTLHLIDLADVQAEIKIKKEKEILTLPTFRREDFAKESDARTLKTVVIALCIQLAEHIISNALGDAVKGVKRESSWLWGK